MVKQTAIPSKSSNSNIYPVAKSTNPLDIQADLVAVAAQWLRSIFV